MSKVLIEEQTLYDIADAVRKKAGVLTTYKPGSMDDAINGIEIVGIPTITEEAWYGLTNAERNLYGLVGIIERSDGYRRGYIINQQSPEVAIYSYNLPASKIDDIKCIAIPNDYDVNSSSWGIGDSPVILGPTTMYDTDSLLLDGKSGTSFPHIDLESINSPFTIYAVIKGIDYADGDVIVMGSVHTWYTGTIINIYHRSGSMWRSSIFGDDMDLIDTYGDYVVVAIRSVYSESENKSYASWFASDGTNSYDRKGVAYTKHGTSFTFGYRDNVKSSDLAAKFIGFVNSAESDAVILANLDNLASIYLAN